MKYFYSYTVYYDCPSCDTNGFGDSEMVHLSDAYDNKKELIESIQSRAGADKFGMLYSLDEWGEIQKICDINERTGFHAVREVSFKLDGFDYQFNLDDKGQFKLQTTDEGYKRIYLDE